MQRSIPFTGRTQLWRLATPLLAVMGMSKSPLGPAFPDKAWEAQAEFCTSQVFLIFWETEEVLRAGMATVYHSCMICIPLGLHGAMA